MTIRLLTLSLVDVEGEVTNYNFDSHATEIIGDRNTGKSTILRILDYLLGDTDSAANTFGAEVAQRYSVLRLELMLSGTEHQLERRPNDQGYAGKVICDGNEIRADKFSDWILNQLGWPIVQIPKGLDPKSANTTIALSFRTLLRHIYRREDSWSELAYKEQVLHRRAVLKYFLGILDNEADMGEYDLANADREVAAMAARLEEARLSAGTALQSVARELGLAVQTWDEVDEVMGQLRLRIDQVNQERTAIASEASSLEGYNAAQTSAYESLSSELVERAAAVADLDSTVNSFAESARIVQGEITRLSRANAAIDVFAEVPVTSCPACGQDVSHKGAEPGVCFLCVQPVTEDNRKRRVELEIRALRDEEAELLEQIDLTSVEADAARLRLNAVQQERESVAAQITDERSALLAPYVTRLEALSAESATHEQAIATLTGLRAITGGVRKIERQLKVARERQMAIQQANIERDENFGLAADRCSRFAGWMNEFLSGLQSEPWSFGPVALRHQDVEFVIKGRPWQEHLGGETKVSFLLAYHYALLRLSELDDAGVRAPGLAILDNPIQQGVPDLAVSEALQRLEECAAETGGSVVSAFARSLPTHSEGKFVVRMTTEYGSDEPHSELTEASGPVRLFPEE